MGHVYIDDSGWGCPVGGVSIGVMKSWWNDVFRTLPVSLFQDEMDMEAILDYTFNEIDGMLAEVCLLKMDTIHICRGPLLAQVRNHLRAMNLRVVPEKIQGAAQMKLEEFHSHYLRDVCGVPIKRETGHGGLSFKWYVEWIKNGHMYHAKTGWKGLQKWIK